MPKIYTKTGDQGMTGLIGGKRVRKDSLRIETYGTVDELNSFLGLAMTHIQAHKKINKILPTLRKIQNELFNLGCQLANPKKSMPGISDKHIKSVETSIDQLQSQLDPIRQFILPGGDTPSALLHVARSICRRAERQCVSLYYRSRTDRVTIRYLNRLADFLFVLARWVAKQNGQDEIFWQSD